MKNTATQLMATIVNAATLTVCTVACASSGALSTDRAVANERSTSPAVHVFESDANGFNTKTVFYDNGSEVVAFDSQFTPEHARQAIEFLRTKTSRPIAYLVVTHPNPDKFNAMSEFQKAGAKVVASRATEQAMPGVHAYKKAYFEGVGMNNYPELGKVDRTFDRTTRLQLSQGDAIEITELASAGVSSNQTVAYIPAAKALIVGDLVHNGAHAWLEGGIVNGKPTPQIAGWVRTLQGIKKQFAGRSSEILVYGGRGNAASLSTAVDEQIAYLKKVDAMVAQFVRNLGERRSELTTEKAGAHYQALQKQFEAAFPTYALGYMIGYGAYGLALAHMN